MSMSHSDCVSKIIIPRVLVPCEEPPQLVDRVLKHWRSDAASATEKKDILARLEEILTTPTGNNTVKEMATATIAPGEAGNGAVTDVPATNAIGTIGNTAPVIPATATTATSTMDMRAERMLQLKFRNVIRVCVSAAVFKEFTSTLVINTRHRDIGMMLMCIMNPPNVPFTTTEAERWMKHDTICLHTDSVDDMCAPDEYSSFDDEGVFSGKGGEAEAVESILFGALITEQSRAKRPSGLKVGVQKDNRRRLLVSGLDQFDLASATGKLREILVAEGRLDMLHTLVFNAVFQEDACVMHLFISQLSTLNGDGEALCDVLLRHHVRSCVERLHNPSMEIVPFGEGNGGNANNTSEYRDCMLSLPISIPNPINIGANLCTYIASHVRRYRGKGKANRVAGRRPY